MTNYNNGKWHGWNGGKCPLHPKTRGEFVFADGSILSKKPAGEWDWDDVYFPIIAFRVTKQYKEPREFWIAYGPDGYVVSSSPFANSFHVREVVE